MKKRVSFKEIKEKTCSINQKQLIEYLYNNAIQSTLCCPQYTELTSHYLAAKEIERLQIVIDELVKNKGVNNHD